MACKLLENKVFKKKFTGKRRERMNERDLLSNSLMRLYATIASRAH